MKCRKCGAKLAANAAFCSQCGARVESQRRSTDLNDADDVDVATGDDNRSPVDRLRRRGRRTAEDESNEHELWSGSFSPRAMVGPAIVCAALSLLALAGVIVTGSAASAWLAFGVAMLVVWGWLGLTLLYRRMTVRYRLTSYRFFHDTGLVARTGNRIQVISIDDVTVRQGPLDRLLSIGTIVLQSKDMSNPELKLVGIEDARRVADLIDGARRAERNRRGLYTSDMG